MNPTQFLRENIFYVNKALIKYWFCETCTCYWQLAKSWLLSFRKIYFLTSPQLTYNQYFSVFLLINEILLFFKLNWLLYVNQMSLLCEQEAVKTRVSISPSTKISTRSLPLRSKLFVYCHDFEADISRSCGVFASPIVQMTEIRASAVARKSPCRVHCAFLTCICPISQFLVISEKERGRERNLRALSVKFENQCYFIGSFLLIGCLIASAVSYEYIVLWFLRLFDIFSSDSNKEINIMLHSMKLINRLQINFLVKQFAYHHDK